MNRPRGRARATVAALLALLAAALPASARQPDDESGWLQKPNVGYGPFRQTSLSPFSSLRMPLSPFFPTSFPAGAFELHVQSEWGKDLTATNYWEIDYEVVASDVSFSWGLSDHFRVELEIVSGERTGGGLDALIIGFHDTFGLALGPRTRFPRNDYRFNVTPPGGGPPVRVDREDPQPFVESALLSFQHAVTFGNNLLPAISYAVAFRAKLGGGGDLEEATPVDLAASLSASKDLSSGFRLYAGAIAAWYGRDNFFGIRLRTWQWSGTTALEWNCLPGFSLVAQYLVTAGAVDGLRDFSRPSNEVAGGFKWELGPGILFEAALIENILNFKNSPDLGFHAGLTIRW